MENCWGCGQDYFIISRKSDLVEIRLDHGEKAKVCPECFFEITREEDCSELDPAYHMDKEKLGETIKHWPDV